MILDPIWMMELERNIGNFKLLNFTSVEYLQIQNVSNMVFRGFVFMFVVSLNIDFARQRHMRYKAKNIIFRRKLAARGVPDLAYLSLSQKLELFGALGITFGSKNISL